MTNFKELFETDYTKTLKKLGFEYSSEEGEYKAFINNNKTNRSRTFSVAVLTLAELFPNLEVKDWKDKGIRVRKV